MFFVNDNQKDRHARIRSLLNDKTASIAVLLASIDFEWTIRRAILAMGKSPTRHIHEKVFAGFNGGYEKYKEAWTSEVKPRINLGIDKVVKNWSKLHGKNGISKIRGAIVHGARVPISVIQAKACVEELLEASTSLELAAINFETKTLFRRIVRRTLR